MDIALLKDTRNNKKYIKLLLLSFTFVLLILLGINSKVIMAHSNSYDNKSELYYFLPTSTIQPNNTISSSEKQIEGQQDCKGYLSDPQGDNVYYCTTSDCPYGNCTWWAFRQSNYISPDLWGIGSGNNKRWGDAFEWKEIADSWGYKTCSTNKETCPVLLGAIAWWNSAPNHPLGHVAYVEGNNPFKVSEMNCSKNITPNYPTPPATPVLWVNQGELDPIAGNNPDGYIYGFPADPVSLYSNDGFFPGNKLVFDTPMNYYNLPDFMNDKTSSIHIAFGWVVKVYEDADVGGGCLRLDSDNVDLSTAHYKNNNHIVNDSISSIQIFNNMCPVDCPGTNNVNDLQANTVIEGICSSPPTDDSAKFIADITLPDGSVVSPGQALTKIWRMKNTGTSIWGEGYKLVLVSGEPMGAPSEVDVPSTSPDQEQNLSVPFVAPGDYGEHSSYWRMRNPSGTYFGDLIHIIISVYPNNPGSHIVVFDATPDSPSEANPVHLIGRINYYNEFRSMRFVVGTDVFEMTNFQQIGNQLEISADWNTGNLERGDYAIAFEVASVGDPDWEHAERQVQIYTLIGSPNPDNHPPDRPILKSPYDWYLKDNAGAPAPVEMCVYPSSDPDGDPVYYYFELTALKTGMSTVVGSQAPAGSQHCNLGNIPGKQKRAIYRQTRIGATKPGTLPWQKVEYILEISPSTSQTQMIPIFV